jgi:hypothetical protein
VTITTSGGTVLGTATADGNGNFTVTLNPPQTNGETCSRLLPIKPVTWDFSQRHRPFIPLPNAPVIATVTDDRFSERHADQRADTDDTTPTLTGTAARFNRHAVQ